MIFAIHTKTNKKTFHEFLNFYFDSIFVDRNKNYIKNWIILKNIVKNACAIFKNMLQFDWKNDVIWFYGSNFFNIFDVLYKNLF